MSEDTVLRGPLESDQATAGTDRAGVPIHSLKEALEPELPGLLLNHPNLPGKFTHVTDEQYEAILLLLDILRDNKVAVLDAPTGSGKTVIAEVVRQLLGLRGLYVCHSLSLQDQFITDFPSSGLVKGRSNYLPERTIKGLTCADCNQTEGRCSWCSEVKNCSYEVAKRGAIRSPLAVLNSTYYLTECNGPGRFSKRPFGILDEADTLEQEVMRFVEIRITPAMQKRLSLTPPTKVTKEESWAAWVVEANDIVSRQRISLDPTEQDVQLIRRAKYVDNLCRKLRLLSDGLANEDWIYTGGKGTPDISFKPVVVDRLGKEYIWGHCGKFLVMSASVISAQVMLENLGYDGDYGTVQMESTFDIRNRAIRVCPVANMGRAANEREELTRGVSAILKEHHGERVLLHTVSYDLADYLFHTLPSRVGTRKYITYRQASERDAAIARFKRTRNACMVAPSLDRGYDFRDEDCRVNVLCKVPFPYLGDKQVAKRLYGPGGQQWYNIQTVRSIVQMTGRGTRHKDDWSVNYILDKNFSSLWNKCKGLFPAWWREAIDWRYSLPIGSPR